MTRGVGLGRLGPPQPPRRYNPLRLWSSSINAATTRGSKWVPESYLM